MCNQSTDRVISYNKAGYGYPVIESYGFCQREFLKTTEPKARCMDLDQREKKDRVWKWYIKELLNPNSAMEL